MAKPKHPPLTPEPPVGADTAIAVHEALARALGIEPRELTVAFQRTNERADDIRRSAAERRERLRAAVRGPKGRFRL